ALVTPGALTVLGTPVDLSQVEVDTYLVAGIADRLTPWQNCYRSTQLLGGGGEPVRAVHKRAHPRGGQPAGQPKGHLPDQQGEPRRAAGMAAYRADRAGQLVDGLPGLARRAVGRRQASPEGCVRRA